MYLNRLVIAGLTTKEKEFAMAAKAYISFLGSSAKKSLPICFSIVFLGLGWAGSSGNAWAQALGDVTSIGASSVTNTAGQVSINEAAGVGNQQNNSALVTDIPGKLTVNQSSF